MWNDFEHKIVRDLAWVICSNCLIDDNIAIHESLLHEEYLKFEPQLKQLDTNPTVLFEFLQTKNARRLGHYFEQLIYFWLHHSDRYTIIGKNIPIRSDKKTTLGEVDLIVQDQETLNFEHWELAVKFYLAHSQNGRTNYIGPNANDYFQLKLEKLKEHQCKILESDEGKKLLSELEISDIQPKLLVKGFLYYHPKQESIPWENIHANHAKSWWVYLKEVENFLSDDYRFALIHKNEWLSKPKTPEKLLSKKDCIEQLNEALKKSPRSLYLACYKNSELMSQGFVVHDNWPDIKT